MKRNRTLRKVEVERKRKMAKDKGKHEIATDAWNSWRVIRPSNTSRSYARGGYVHKLLKEHDKYERAGGMHVGGGCQDPGGDKKPPKEWGDGHEIGY